MREEREEEEEQQEPVRPLVPIVDQLLNLRVSKIQSLRFVPLEEWFTEPRETVGGPF